MRTRCIALVMLAILVTTGDSIASNENATLVLHAAETFSSCTAPQQTGLDCETILPNVNVAGLDVSMIYMYIRNYTDVVGVVCAFEWPATWSILGNTWDCLEGQVTPFYPIAPGPAPGQAMLMTVFNAVSGGMLEPLGMMIVSHPGPGCLTIIESTDPCGDGCALVDFANQCCYVPVEHRARVCHGAGGYDACDPAATPVESTTWGAIKGQYR